MTKQGNAREHLSLADVARRTAVIIAVVGGSLLLALLVYELRTILVWVLIAGMLAVTIAPAVSWLERRRVPRWLGASLVTLAAALALGALVIAVAVPLVGQSRDLIGNLPHLAHDLFKPGGPLAFADQRFHIERRIGVITPGRLFDLVAGPRSIASLFTRTAAVVAAVVTIVTITVMLLVEGPRAGGRSSSPSGLRVSGSATLPTACSARSPATCAATCWSASSPAPARSSR